MISFNARSSAPEAAGMSGAFSSTWPQSCRDSKWRAPPRSGRFKRHSGAGSSQ